MKKKLIAWENWNEIEKMSALEYNPPDEDDEPTNQFYELVESNEQSGNFEEAFQGMLSEMNSQFIYTPFGQVPFDSRFKPSDRWECWLGYTNFGLTKKTVEALQHVEGVDALKVLSRYSFCVGIGKLFNFSEVKQGIQDAICN